MRGMVTFKCDAPQKTQKYTREIESASDDEHRTMMMMDVTTIENTDEAVLWIHTIVGKIYTIITIMEQDGIAKDCNFTNNRSTTVTRLVFIHLQ